MKIRSVRLATFRPHRPALALAALCLLPGCDGGEEAKTSVAALPAEIKVSGELHLVQAATWPEIVKVQGSLYSDEVTSLAAKVSGRVVEVNCDLGDVVQQGDPLIKLDNREYELRVAQSEAQLTQARAAIGLSEEDSVTKLDPLKSPPVREAKAILDEARQRIARLKTLYKQQAVVATEIESAESLEQVAEARFNSSLNSVREKIAMVSVQSAALELSKQELLDTTITAPFNGMIQNRTISVGSYLQAGVPILEVAKTSVLRFRAAVPERYAQRLQVGQMVRIMVNNTVRQTNISRISPTLDPLSRSLVFEAELPNDDSALRSGLFAQAELILDEDATAIVIPSSAMARFAGVDKTWRIDNGAVSEAVVQVGREMGGLVEIKSGLTAGDQILSEGKAGKVGKYVSNSSSTIKPDEADTKPVSTDTGSARDATADSLGKNTVQEATLPKNGESNEDSPLAN